MHFRKKTVAKVFIIFLNAAAIVLGLIGVFCLLFLISEELFFPFATTLFLVVFLGFVNYLIWGRYAEKFVPQKAEVAIPNQEKAEKTAPWNEIVLELDEQERMELVRILEDSLATTVKNGAPTPQPRENKDYLHQKMLDKLRMFGA